MFGGWLWGAGRLQQLCQAGSALLLARLPAGTGDNRQQCTAVVCGQSPGNIHRAGGQRCKAAPKPSWKLSPPAPQLALEPQHPIPGCTGSMGLWVPELECALLPFIRVS